MKILYLLFRAIIISSMNETKYLILGATPAFGRAPDGDSMYLLKELKEPGY